MPLTEQPNVTDRAKVTIDHMEDNAATQVEKQEERSWAEITDAARIATQQEHDLKLADALRKYPKAVAWSVFVSLACVMEGYDMAFITSLFAQRAFQRDFGEPQGDWYQITAPWQTGLGLAAKVGMIVGIFLNGYLADKFGIRRLMLCCHVLIVGFTFIVVFARSLPELLVGEILCGIPWGIFNTSAPAYASEVCPMALRGYLTTFINLAWIIGQLISAGVLRGVSGMMSRWAYGIPFALQWSWPVPLFIGLLFCPDSPWWLLRKDRLEDAKRSLERLSVNTDCEQTLAMMIHTDQLEQQEGNSSYLDCFKGADLRRTEIAACTWAIPLLCGLPLQTYNTYFFEQAGLPNTRSFDITIGYYAIGMCGTFVSWFLITWFGRRAICLVGMCCMTVVLLAIGFTSLAERSNSDSAWAQASLLLVWVWLYDATIGPLAFCTVSEVGSTRLRAKTIVIGRNSFYVVYIVFSVVTPYMLNPTEGNWRGKAAFLFAGTSALSLIWMYFRLPELKGRTFEELDILFKRRIPARKFKSAKVDAYEDEDRHTSAS